MLVITRKPRRKASDFSIPLVGSRYVSALWLSDMNPCKSKGIRTSNKIKVNATKKQ